MEASELDYEEAPAIKALGSLFTLTQLFLRDDCYVATRETLSESLNDETVSDTIIETTEDMELSRQMDALGLPVSFRTSKAMRNGMARCKTKGMNTKHPLSHDGNEGLIDLTEVGDNIAVDTEKVGLISIEEEVSEDLTSMTCVAVDEADCEGLVGVKSECSLNSEATLYSESLEVLDHDKTDSEVIEDLEVWASYWDSFYSRYYFYNTKTNESTWDPPLGMEHLAYGEVIDKPNEMIGDIVENIGSQCSLESSISFGESKKDHLSMDQIPCDTCLSFEMDGENFHNSTSTLNDGSKNLDEAQEILKESLFSVVHDCEDCCGGEIKLEKVGIMNILQSATECAMQEEETKDDLVIIKQKKKARKRTRLNRKSSELQFQGILEEGISEERGILEKSPSSKYWCQRYQLFSRYDYGIKMDEEGWFSATPELIAKHHAIRCGDGVIVDCFTGVGGNAIRFARRSRHVIAIDIDPKKIEYAKHNAAIYGVADRIDFIIGDSFILAPNLKADTVFLSPPWGGPNYLKATTYDINTMLKPHGGDFLFKVAKGIASKVVMFLPRTVDLKQLAELALSVNPPWSLEVERNYLNGKLKAITAYFTETSPSS